MKHAVSLEVDSTVEDVSIACVAMNAIHEHFSLPRLLRYQLELCVDEVLNNIVEHDFAFEKGHPMRLKLEMEPKCVVIEVRYLSMQKELLNWTERKERPDADDLPERGFGCFLVNEIMDEVTVSREGEETLVHMRRELTEEARPKGKRERV